MPWVCFRTFSPGADGTPQCRPGLGSHRSGRLGPWNRLLPLLPWGLLVAAVLVSSVAAPAQAEPPWRRGVFPVVSFFGYSSHFGLRAGPGGGAESHYGLDIAAPLGSPIRNWWGGVVSEVLAGGACGNGLVIRSGPYEHLYCHLAGEVSAGVYRSGEVLVAPGQRLQAGALIGHVGITGRTTGPHLHWGIRYRGQWLDPAAILRAMARARQGS